MMRRAKSSWRMRTITPLVQIRVEVGNTYLPAAITLQRKPKSFARRKQTVKCRTLRNEPGEGFVFGLFSRRDIHATA